MGNYGQCALRAVERIQNFGEDPVIAWKNAAAATFPGRISSQQKGCPKGAFLGLCQEGLIKDVPRGTYTRSKDNKRYAVEAVMLLKKDSRLANDAGALWDSILSHPWHENGQMEVVLTLWKKSLIV
jgi:Family of unknown function (DUF6979)